MYNIATGETQQVAAHDAPIKCCQVVVVQGQEMLITASWDKRLRVCRLIPIQKLGGLMWLVLGYAIR